MSTHEGENKDGQRWPTQSDSLTLSFEQLELEHHRKLDDKEITPRGHARLANQLRDDYILLGNPESLNQALRHYEAALEESGREPLLRAWIICNRANLFIHDLPTGRALPGDLAEELSLAQSILGRTLTWRDRKFKTHTLAWIDRTRTKYLSEPTPAEITQEFSIPALRLVGGAAIEGTAVPGPAPEPGAA